MQSGRIMTTVKYANNAELVEIRNADQLCQPLPKNVRLDPESKALVQPLLGQEKTVRCEVTVGIIRTYPGLNDHEASGVLTFMVDIEWDTYMALPEHEVTYR